MEGGEIGVGEGDAVGATLAFDADFRVTGDEDFLVASGGGGAAEFGD